MSERGLTRGRFVAGAAGGALALASGGLIEVLRRRSAFGYDGQELLGGTLQPVTPTDDFYVVTKNLVDPRVDRDAWRLEISGLVERPRTLRFEDLGSLPSVEQETTLECISNGVGGGLLSNAVWAGVPLRALIEEAGPKRGAKRLFFHAADGFTHSTPLERGMQRTTLLAVRMNGELLTDRHGFPARLIVPGAYGELSVKWIDRIELIDDGRKGYYEQQGWRAERVHTMSRIDLPAEGKALRASAPATLRGVAFAGDRGIARVEASTDGGRSWRRAKLDYAPSKLTWALWSLPWAPREPGTYELVVRATDGEGELQSTVEDNSVPDGASGLHRIAVTVQA
ncbi:MAG: molybdopterin-dependent oxidoreductase [Actinobacteria bacterium]|nr:molybdopterin-dependent oxidoreductase [Actinomycetota bacterium]